MAHFVEGSLITSFSMTNSLWVTLHICNCQSHDIFSYDQQQVIEIVHFVKGSLITSFPTGCEWYCTFCGRQSHHLFSLWPTACEWYCTFWERQPHHTFSCDQQRVSDIAHFVTDSLIDQLSKWVTIDILRKAVSWHLSLIWIGCEWHCHIGHFASHLFLWPTGSGWHCTFCEGSLITSSPMTNSLWVMLPICERQFHHIFSYV